MAHFRILRYIDIKQVRNTSNLYTFFSNLTDNKESNINGIFPLRSQEYYSPPNENSERNYQQSKLLQTSELTYDGKVPRYKEENSFKVPMKKTHYAYYDHSPSFKPTSSSSISFSNSLLNPQTFMKGTHSGGATQHRTKQTIVSNDSPATLSSITDLWPSTKPQNVKNPTTLYSYFESKKARDHERHNKHKIAKGDPVRRLIKADKEDNPLIPNSWSELVIGRWPNIATKYLDLVKRRSDLSSFKKGAREKLDDFSTKKLRWLLNRTKRDANSKTFLGTTANHDSFHATTNTTCNILKHVRMRE